VWGERQRSSGHEAPAWEGRRRAWPAENHCPPEPGGAPPAEQHRQRSGCDGAPGAKCGAKNEPEFSSQASSPADSADCGQGPGRAGRRGRDSTHEPDDQQGREQAGWARNPAHPEEGCQ